MTTLCIDELSRTLKRRWGWTASATHVPADADCPLLTACGAGPAAEKHRPGRATVPQWLQPGRGFDRPPGIDRLHGKGSPSMG